MTDEDIAYIYNAIANAPKRDWRGVVEYVEQHPELLSALDAPMSFDEFVRCVRGDGRHDIRAVGSADFDAALKLYEDIFAGIGHPMIPDENQRKAAALQILSDGGGLGVYDGGLLIGILLSFDYGAVCADRNLRKLFFPLDENGCPSCPVVHRQAAMLLDKHGAVRFLWAFGICNGFRNRDHAKALALEWAESYPGSVHCGLFYDRTGVGSWVMGDDFDSKWIGAHCYDFMSDRPFGDDYVYLPGLWRSWADDEKRPGIFRRLISCFELIRLKSEIARQTDMIEYEDCILSGPYLCIDPPYWKEVGLEKLAQLYFRRAMLEEAIRL